MNGTEFDEFVKPRKIRKDKKHHGQKHIFDDEVPDTSVRRAGKGHGKYKIKGDDLIDDDLYDGVDIEEIKRILK